MSFYCHACDYRFPVERPDLCCPRCGEGRHMVESSSESEGAIAEGGYCFDCHIAFEDERAADTHYAMSGHQIGWPCAFEDVDDWPLATPEQIMWGGFRGRGALDDPIP